MTLISEEFTYQVVKKKYDVISEGNLVDIKYNINTGGDEN